MKRRKFMRLNQWDVDHLVFGALFTPGNSDSMRVTMIRLAEANAGQLTEDTRLTIIRQISRTLWQFHDGYMREQWSILAKRHLHVPHGRLTHRQGLYLTETEALTLFMLAFRYDVEHEHPAALLWEQYANRYPQVLRDGRWAYAAARMLLEGHYIPQDEPLGNIRSRCPYPKDIPAGFGPGDDWRRFFRLMRDTAEQEPVIPLEDRAADDWIRVMILDADYGEEYI